MKRYFVILLCGFLAGCTASGKEQTQKADVENTVKAYFHTLEKADFQHLHDLTTEAFVLFEDGRRWNNDSLIDSIKKVIEVFPEASIQYELREIETLIDEHLATLRYHNIGTMTLPDTVIEFHWLESAALERVGDEWKIRFLQSSPVPD